MFGSIKIDRSMQVSAKANVGMSKREGKTMYKIICFITIVLLLQGCGNNPAIQESETVTTTFENGTLEVEYGVLSKAIPEYSDIYDIGVPINTGQSEIIRISEKEFVTVTQAELTQYLIKKKKCEKHDWHAVVIDGNTAILCSYNQDKFIYGIWNEDIGITDILAEYEDVEDVITCNENDSLN